MFRPFPGDLLGEILKGRKGVAVLERVDQPLAEDLPLIREVRAALGRCLENGRFAERTPALSRRTRSYRKPDDMPPLYSGSFGLGSRDLQPEGLIGAIENMLPNGGEEEVLLSLDRFRARQALHAEAGNSSDSGGGLISRHRRNWRSTAARIPNLMPKNSITVRLHSVGGWGAITTGKNLAMTLVRSAGIPHQGKSEIRFGEEGPADHLLPVGGAGADSHQLRLLLCRRGAVARSERVSAFESAGRA